MMRKFLLALCTWALAASAGAVPATWTVPGLTIIHSYTSGSAATETVPAGTSAVIVEEWGGGGGGKKNSSNTGGGSGGYLLKTLVITSSNWGQTFTYTVGGGGAADASDGTASTVVNATFATSFTGTANGGGHGVLSGGTAVGGMATGGDTNTTGNSTTVNAGGAAIVGRFNRSAGAGGLGGPSFAAGADGQIVFSYQ